MWIDFEYQLRKNPAFRSKIEKAIKAIQDTFKDMHKDNKHRKLYIDAINNYLQISNFNLAPLLPYYYPNYPDGPYTLKDFPFAYCYYALNLGEGSYNVLRGSRQIGKCLYTNSLCKIRNKKTGETKEITIGELFKLAKNKEKSIKNK